MKLSIDKNNLLVIENENILKTKEYCHNVSWYEFCDFDKLLIVYHKKQFKIINLKDLGDKMWVIMIWEKDEELNNLELDLKSVESALKLFEGFDEETGNKYYFLYKFKESELEILNKNLSKLGVKTEAKKTEKWICCDYLEEELEYNPASFLFGLTLVYWDFVIKNGDLRAIKIQLPLFGKYKENVDILDETIATLSDNWIFVKKNIQKTNDGIVYQITSSDFELLRIFASFYQAIEKWLKISKYDDTQKIKDELVEFLKTNPEIPNEWREEMINEIEKWEIKLLIKS